MGRDPTTSPSTPTSEEYLAQPTSPAYLTGSSEARRRHVRSLSWSHSARGKHAVCPADGAGTSDGRACSSWRGFEGIPGYGAQIELALMLACGCCGIGCRAECRAAMHRPRLCPSARCGRVSALKGAFFDRRCHAALRMARG